MKGASSFKEAREKIGKLNQELDSRIYGEIKAHRKRMKILLGIFITLLVSSLITFVVLVHLDIIKLFREDTPSKIKLLTATATEEGYLRILLEIEEGYQGRITPDYHDVKAHIVDLTDGAEFFEDVIPIYLRNKTRLMIEKPGLMALPGYCQIQVTIEGRKKKSNDLVIRHLSHH